MKKNRRPVELLLTSLGLVACLALSSLAVEANQRAESSDQDILLHVETPDFRLDGGGLSVPDYGVNAVPGAPALPVWSTLVTLPPDGEWSLSFQSQGERSLQAKGAIPAVPVPSLDLNGPINWLDRTDLPAEVPLKDAPDPDIYQRSAFYPETAVVAGPVQWQRGQRLLPVRVFPFQLNPVTGELLYRPDLTVTIHVEAGEPKAAQAPADPSSNTPEEIDGALRINTGDRGLYRLTHADLQAAGVPLATTDPDTFALFYLGEPVDIQVVGGDDGHFDPGDLVIFYAEPYQGRYMTHNVYRFTYGGSTNGDRMESRAVTPTGNEPLVTTATQTVHVEFDRDYRSVYNLPSDADHWFDTVLFANVVNPTVTRTYDLDAVSAFQVASGDAELRVALHGGTAQVPNPDQSVRVSLNGHQADTFQWDGQTSYLAVATVPTTWLDGAPNQVHLTAALDQLSDITSYWVSPNWVELSFPAQAEAVNDRLYMEAIPVTGRRAQVRVSGFSSPDVRVYDVRDARQPVQLLTLQTGNTGGQVTVDFWDAWPAGV
ncbi:MAG: hypothetical protein ACK2U9_21085 [Anaerolineae bacterium]